MSSDEEEKEIAVQAPLRPAVSPEKREEKTAVRSLEEERFGVLQFPRRISRYVGIVAEGTGVLLLSLFVYVIVTGQASYVILSSGAGSLGLFFWGVVGLVNVVVGLLLMGRD